MDTFSSESNGGIAQLVERLNGIQKVRGSTPLTSTIIKVKEGEVHFSLLSFLRMAFKTP